MCKVLRKELLILRNNQLDSLLTGGSVNDLELINILDLSFNKFTEIPAALLSLKNLRVCMLIQLKCSNLERFTKINPFLGTIFFTQFKTSCGGCKILSSNTMSTRQSQVDKLTGNSFKFLFPETFRTFSCCMQESWSICVRLLNETSKNSKLFSFLIFPGRLLSKLCEKNSS